MSANDNLSGNVTQSYLVLSPGSLISHYKIVKKIGSGGMGEVYLAVDDNLDRPVALKFLPTWLSEETVARERFLVEAKTASKLNHPNILTIYGVESYQGKDFIVMEYVEGESLKTYAGSRDMSFSRMIDICIQICDGLSKAHQAGVVHRDIKPQNILLDKDGRVKICDFGLAKTKGAAKLTMVGSTVGTISYMSPEQTLGQEVDARSDIFSFGAVFYEMITGRTPFERNNEAATINAILKDSAEPLARYKSNVPDDFQRIIDKALAKDSSARYQHVDDIIVDLKSIRNKSDWSRTKERATTRISAPSIAVLPFADMSPQKDQQYFCDGIAEELINALTQIDGLRVVSRTSAFQFKGQDQDFGSIGEKLHVNTVLEGSVRKAGNRLRVTVELVNVADGYHLWSEKYDRDMEDIFAIQDEISRTIVQTLRPKLMKDSEIPMIKRFTEDIEAYNLYLKGRYFWNMRSKDSVLRGMDYFHQAIDRDPNYALAYIGVADSYGVLIDYNYMNPATVRNLMKDALDKALALDDQVAETHSSLGGWYYFMEWDFAKADQEFRRAIELNPSYATSHHWYFLLLSSLLQFDEAYAEIKRAQELDPRSIVINMCIGVHWYVNREYDKAIQQLKSTLEMDPNFWAAYTWMAWALTAKGLHTEAISQIKTALKIEDNPVLRLQLCYVYAKAGELSRARLMYDDLVKEAEKNYVSPAFFADVQWLLGEKDKAFESFQKGFENRDGQLLNLHFPEYDDMRSDPRFIELQNKIGLGDVVARKSGESG